METPNSNLPDFNQIDPGVYNIEFDDQIHLVGDDYTRIQPNDSIEDGTNVSPEKNIVAVEGETPNGSRFWTPLCDEKPVIDMIFHSLEQTYNFYKNYARKSGFSIKKGGGYEHNSLKSKIKYFYCVKEGFNPPSKPATSRVVVRKRPSQRCGCKARIALKRIGDKFKLYKFIENHNHSLVSRADLQFVNAYRQLTYTKKKFLFDVSMVNVGPVRGFNVLKEIYGGFEQVGATSNDCKNFKRAVLNFIGDRDAQMVVEKLLSRKSFLLNYSFEYNTDSENALSMLFWADGDAKTFYQSFGDVISFDATFRSNKYKMVFVPFTGIDNHNRCVTFGAGLLAKETIESYSWLLSCFKRAFGEDPKVVVTDQDPAMKQVVSLVFPNSRHRLCMWHIMQKFTAKVGSAICSQDSFKKRVCDIVWTDQIDEFTFEEEWNSIIHDFDLHQNNWLSDIYAIRESWIPAYYRDEPLSGLMRTSSRSESENHFFGQLTNANLTLVEFISHFDTAMDSQRYKYDKNSHDSRYTVPEFKTKLLIEKEAAELYTRTIFFDVQDEIYCSLMHCMCLNVEDRGSYRYFMINDNRSDVVRRRGNEQTRFEVSFNVEDQTAECGCKRFESFGLLCRHVFYVFRMLNISNFPKRYLLNRWSRDGLSSRVGRVQIDLKSLGDKATVVETAFREINGCVEEAVNLLVNTPEKLVLYLEKQRELFKQFTTEISDSRHVDKNTMIATMLGVSEPTEVSIKVPQGIRNKGSGSKKCLKSKREEETEKLKKLGFKKCGFCDTYVKNHDARNCPEKAANSSKMPMVSE